MSEAPLPAWAREAIEKGEAVTVRGRHIPAESPGGYASIEEMVEELEGEVDDPEALAANLSGRGGGSPGGAAAPAQQRPDNMARTSPPTHPNCRSHTNVTVDGDIDDVEGAVRKAVEKVAEEVHERSKNLLKR